MTTDHTRTRQFLILGKGDTGKQDAPLRRLARYARLAGQHVQRLTYHELHKAEKKDTTVFLAFPQSFWNTVCEKPKDTSLHGTNRRAYELYDALFARTTKELEEHIGRRRVRFLTNPFSAGFLQDRIASAENLDEMGVPTPERVHTRDTEEVLHIALEQTLYLKSRYGNKGKGMIILRPNNWTTNYAVRQKRLTNPRQWQFRTITGQKELVTQFLSHDIIIEKEVATGDLYDGKTWDVRCYVVDDTPVHYQVRIHDETAGAQHLLHDNDAGLPATYEKRLQLLARHVAAVTDQKIAAVDIIFNGNAQTPKVLACHPFFDFPDVKKYDLAKYLIEESGLLHE
ncbi:hypothetical protein GF342_05785 [Candidatus Woesearchaeota archaeon]|nr:hypothetical protein [Candidatus Woesearchaeota archaeon]